MWLLVRFLTPEEQARLEELARSSEPVTYRRARIILLSSQDRRVPEIMAALGLSDRTVRDTLHRFHQGGVAALPRRKPPGAPRRCDPAAHEALVELLHRPPPTSGSRAVSGPRPIWRPWPRNRGSWPSSLPLPSAARSAARGRVGVGRRCTPPARESRTTSLATCRWHPTRCGARAARFAAALGATVSSKGVTNPATVINQLAANLYDFAAWYAAVRWIRSGELRGRAAVTACTHMKGAAREVATVFVTTLSRAIASPRAAIQAPGPYPAPTAPGSCESTLFMVASTDVSAVRKQLEKLRTDLVKLFE